MTRTIPDDWRTDHLFVLVGGNPLPNYVAARLLLKEGGCLHLVCSSDTTELAKRIAGPNISSLRHEVDPADPHDIYEVVNDALTNDCQGGTIGLNYTGGTKAMSVHAHQVIKEQHPNAIFTYLDAKTLGLRRDDEMRTYSIQYAITPSLKDLLDLQDIALQKTALASLDQDPVPLYPDLNQALAEAHKTKEGRMEYDRWCRLNLRRFKKSSQSKYEQIVGNIRATNEHLPEKNFYHYATQEIRLFDFSDTELMEKMTHLPPSPIPLPEHSSLEAVSNRMREVFGLTGNTLDMDQLGIKTNKELNHLVEYLDGKWVEHLTLGAFLQKAKDRHVHNIAMSLNTDGGETYDFEFDVAAMQGYQLYAVSCTRDSSKPLCKSKLFEAYIRARQLGGDEARVGLVCAYETPSDLQDEVIKNWGMEHKEGEKDPKRTQKQIRVFGAEDLSNLSEKIDSWLA